MALNRTCDYGHEIILPNESFYEITATKRGGGEPTAPVKQTEMCLLCYASAIILSEQRRTRTRRKKAGKGRKAKAAEHVAITALRNEPVPGFTDSTANRYPITATVQTSADTLQEQAKEKMREIKAGKQ